MIARLKGSKMVGAAVFVVAILSLALAPFKYSVVAATACEPDPANPLKCFCEEVNRDIAGASKDSKKICKINDTENASGSQRGLLGENGIIKKVLNLLSWITGFLAAIYLIVGGFKIITSSGDSDSVASGRKMIVYAMVGVLVVISSNLIINLVIGAVNNASK